MQHCPTCGSLAFGFDLSNICHNLPKGATVKGFILCEIDVSGVALVHFDGASQYAVSPNGSYELWLVNIRNNTAAPFPFGHHDEHFTNVTPQIGAAVDAIELTDIAF